MDRNGVPTDTTRHEADRLLRLKSALVEHSVASTSALVGFLATLYRYSPDTLAHVQRVAAASLCIGDTMALSTEELRHLERAALAHDLGAFILAGDVEQDGPPGPPPAGERKGRQAALGRELLAATPVLRRAADIVGAQFERMDGTGWPAGLSGDQIPVGARIVGVADAYDALVSLCLELGLTAETIAVELVRHAGTRFDARVVAACLRWMDGSPAGVPALSGSAGRLM